MPDVPNLATEPDLVIDGKRLFFLWNPWSTKPSIPKGVMIDHRNRRGEPCIAWLPWTSDDNDPNEPCWTLLSLRPLSIAESFVCTRCGLTGGFRYGAWWIALQ